MRNGKRTALIVAYGVFALLVTVVGMWLVWGSTSVRETVGAVLAFVLALRLVFDALTLWLNGPAR